MRRCDGSEAATTTHNNFTLLDAVVGKSEGEISNLSGAASASSLRLFQLHRTLKAVSGKS